MNTVHDANSITGMTDRELIEGNVAKALVTFTIPLVLSGIFQQLFAWVDAFIVGNFNGETALGGIGATTSIYNLFVTILTGLALGISVFSAQLFGSGKKEICGRLLSSYSVLLGIISAAAAAAGSFFSGSILSAMDTPADIYASAESYLSVLLLGLPFLAIYNVYSAILRGIGNSRMPFVAIVISSSVNVVLDIILVAYMGKGVAGAAAATVVSQAAMAIFIVIYACVRYPYLRFRPGIRAIDGKILAQGAAFAIPPAIQSGATSIGSVILQQFMNGFGAQTVAAITTAYRVDTVVLLPIINLGAGISTAVAQNMGAGNDERARNAVRAGVIMMIGVSLLLTLFVFLAGGSLIALFGLEAETVAIGEAFFHSLAAFYVVFGLSTALRGYIEGIGDMLFSGIAGILSLAVRIAASYALVGIFGSNVIAYAEIIAWLFLLAVIAVRFFSKYSKGKAPGKLQG